MKLKGYSKGPSQVASYSTMTLVSEQSGQKSKTVQRSAENEL
jgi:hypothetical protein